MIEEQKGLCIKPNHKCFQFIFHHRQMPMEQLGPCAKETARNRQTDSSYLENTLLILSHMLPTVLLIL